MFTLIDLPYRSLSPVVSDQTLAFHHGKHLKGYVDNLNRLIAGTPLENLSLEEVIVRSDGAIFNNAGQILNHNLYFLQFAPSSEASHSELAPESALSRQIIHQWGSMDAFFSEFEAKGASLFGSGWVWLASADDGSLEILQCPGADNPVAHGLNPILTYDVWEHAYYLDYQNRRADYLHALRELIDWRVVEGRLHKEINYVCKNCQYK